MTLTPFQRADVTPILERLLRDCDPEHIVSLFFRAAVPPAHSTDTTEQWLRLRGILGCHEVYEALGLQSLPTKAPASFNYATGLEVIGTLANLLMRGGVHSKFVDDCDEAITLSREFLDKASYGRYEVEAYSSREPWCEWFIGEGILDETVLIGWYDEWWLLAITGTD